MHVGKLRLPGDEPGLVPAGHYFARLAAALREANKRAGNREPPRAHRYDWRGEPAQFPH